MVLPMIFYQESVPSVFEYIFGIDTGAPIYIYIYIYIYMARFWREGCFLGGHSFPCRSLLSIRTTVLNDIQTCTTGVATKKAANLVHSYNTLLLVPMEV